MYIIPIFIPYIFATVFPIIIPYFNFRTKPANSRIQKPIDLPVCFRSETN